MTHLDIQAKVTKTAAFNGAAVDVSAITGDWTLVLEVFGLDAGATASFAYQWSNDASPFGTNTFNGPAVSVVGGIGADSPTNSASDVAGQATGYFANPKRYTFKKADFPGLQGFGVTSPNHGNIRLSLQAIAGTGSTDVTYSGFVEY